jgi:Tol biopolymer transport system component/DNA-binding winged helix-turn-helix (wHTH) protein
MSSKPSVPVDRWRFGQFEIDLSTGELRKNGLRVHIQEQPLRILGALLERAGELVTREELRERLWPSETFVNFERSLNAAVAKLRQVLADSAEQPRYVETVARRGYRFVAPVEASLPLQEAAELPLDSIAGAAGGSISRRQREQWVWPAAALILLVLVSTGVYLLKGRHLVFSKTDAVSFAVYPPEGTRAHVASAVSPDGRKLAFIAIDTSGHRTLWVRTLASETALRLENTEGAAMPFFSPDSQNIGFFADGKLKRIPASGGSPQTLCDQSQPAGATWNQDNIILFSQEGRLYQVSAAGGSATQLTQPDQTPGAIVMDTWPQFLPDGRHFVFCARIFRGRVNPTRSGILLGSLDSTSRQFLLASRTRAAVTPSGYLLFVRGGTLLAQRLDLSRFQLVGAPLAVAENLTVNMDRLTNIPRPARDAEVKAGLPATVPPAAFSVSDNGVLVYHSAPPQKSQLVWYSRDGKRLGTAGEPREYNQLFLSPDERLAAVSIRNDKMDRTHWNIWLLHLETNVLSRLTFGDGLDADPVWSPDSSKIVYGSYKAEEGEKIDLMELTLGERSPRLFYTDGRANKPEAWSPDGRFFLFKREEQAIFSLPTSGDRKPAALLDTPYAKGRFQFSPDGHWLAYMSPESGAPEIYASSFPDMTRTRQISTGGGCTPVWRKDGKELFYMAAPGQVMSVDVKAGFSFETSPPKMLFHAGEVPLFTQNYCIGQYGVAANGQKFLLIETPHSPIDDGRMHVVTHWDAALPH